MAQRLPALVEVSLEKTVLMPSGKKRPAMTFPTSFQFFGLANVCPVGMGIEDLVDTRLERVFIVN